MKVQRTFSPHTGIFNDDDDRDTSHASKPKTVVISGLYPTVIIIQSGYKSALTVN